MILQIEVIDARSARPSPYQEVLAWHRHGCDRAMLHGDIWRLADGGEDQLHDVTHWAPLPDVSDLLKKAKKEEKL